MTELDENLAAYADGFEAAQDGKPHKTPADLYGAVRQHWDAGWNDGSQVTRRSNSDPKLSPESSAPSQRPTGRF